ncbi:MAG: hypothetical protein AB2A00_16375 [Myxococcota bacterium]
MLGVVSLVLMVACAEPAPSVAVTPLSARQGVTPDLADLLTDNLIKHIRESNRFSRVVSAKEVQATLNFEMQKQLLQCTDTSCMAEVAASLGVDFLITGTLGRVGSFWLLNISLVSVRTGQNAGSVSESIPAVSEDTLLLAMPGVVGKLLKDLPGGSPLVLAPAPAAPPQVPAPPPVEATSGGGPSVPALALGGVGGVGAVVGVLGVVTALLGSGMALGTLAYFNTTRGADKNYDQLNLAWMGGWAVLGLGVLLGLLGGVAAVAGGVGYVVMR